MRSLLRQFSIMPSGWSRNTELSHFSRQGRPLQPKPVSCAIRSAHYPISLAQRQQDVFTFGFHQGAGAISNLLILDGRAVAGPEKRFNWRVKNAILRKDNRSLSEVLQLPYVSRPRMSGERQTTEMFLHGPSQVERAAGRDVPRSASRPIASNRAASGCAQGSSAPIAGKGGTTSAGRRIRT
jgi:hypothetical protein